MLVRFMISAVAVLACSASALAISVPGSAHTGPTPVIKNGKVNMPDASSVMSRVCDSRGRQRPGAKVSAGVCTDGSNGNLTGVPKRKPNP